MKIKDQIDKDFIEAFGIEQFKIQEAFNKLEQFSELVAEYLEVSVLPIVSEPIKEDSRIYYKEQFIMLRPDISLNELEAKKAIAHEYRHYYQFLCIKNAKYDEPLLHQYLEGFQYMIVHGNKNDGTSDYYSLIIEIDAFAFQKYFLKEVLGIETHYPNEDYDKILDKFIKNFY